MAIIAAQTIAWGTPSVMPQSQAASFVTSSMVLASFPQPGGVVAAPQAYGNIVPAPLVTDNFYGGIT